ncbi:hypothetical protein H257_16803 [Aphanomyces astaci]|uniref:Uncharacterized protein n=1 Tax=Aphanomyces astaci TaxID=112090 RepID=W4FJF1_APHAT|nr:hypothetical protein H257_16803 [Aphanomyces astaci]ETV66873.1 hypothetical protein H257_16803 [Aphanomyces astaci]|eukprot:XP_009843676.1 hypothetical protein H257_16803 [Aphanomyces astaci]
MQTDGVMLLLMAKTVRQRQFVLALLATQHVERPLIPEVRFNLDAMTDANAVLDYRFDVVGNPQTRLLCSTAGGSELGAGKVVTSR